MPSIVRQNRISFYLHPPFRINEGRDLDKRTGGPDFGETFAMRSRGVLPFPDVREHDPRPQDIGKRSTAFYDRLLDDIEATPRLLIDILADRRSPIGCDGRRSGYCHIRSASHGAGKPDFGLQARP